MSDIEHISHDEALDIIRRLAQAFQFVDTVIAGEHAKHQIWVIHGQENVGVPTIQSFSDIADVCKLIAELRAKQNVTATVRYYMHIIHGQRWKIQKGRIWQIWDGTQMIPIEGGDLEPVVDETGSLFERVDLDQVLPNNIEEAPETPVQSNPVRITPHTVGRLDADEDEDDLALPGHDPELV